MYLDTYTNDNISSLCDLPLTAAYFVLVILPRCICPVTASIVQHQLNEFLPSTLGAHYVFILSALH